MEALLIPVNIKMMSIWCNSIGEQYPIIIFLNIRNEYGGKHTSCYYITHIHFNVSIYYILTIFPIKISFNLLVFIPEDKKPNLFPGISGVLWKFPVVYIGATPIASFVS